MMSSLNGQSQWTVSVIGSFAWRPGVFEPEPDGGQRLVESFDDVDAATLVPFITVGVLATVNVQDVQISNQAQRAEAALVVRAQTQRMIGRQTLGVGARQLLRVAHGACVSQHVAVHDERIGGPARSVFPFRRECPSIARLPDADDTERMRPITIRSILPFDELDL